MDQPQYIYVLAFRIRCCNSPITMLAFSDYVHNSVLGSWTNRDPNVHIVQISTNETVRYLKFMVEGSKIICHALCKIIEENLLL